MSERKFLIHILIWLLTVILLHNQNFLSGSTTQYGYTPLITAAECGNCDVVIELLNNAAVIDAQNNVSHSPCDVVRILRVYVTKREMCYHYPQVCGC